MKKLLLTFYFFLFTFSFFLLPFPFLFGQWPTTVDSALLVDFGLYPYLAVDEHEESVIVIYIAGNDILKAKKYDRYGYALWGNNAITLVDTTLAFGMNLSNLSNQWGAVISDDSGGAVVCWEDFRHATFDPFQNPENNEIYIQRVDGNGQVRYGTNGRRISTPASAGWHTLGDMKPDYHGGFVVGFNNDSSNTTCVLKRLNIDGNLIWEKYFLGQYMDIPTTDLQGNVFINIAPYAQQSRQKLNSIGNNLWPDSLIGFIPDSRAYRAGGSFSDGEDGVIGVGELELKINRVDSTGQYVFGPNGIDLGQGQQGRIGYAADGDGGIYVSWTKNGSRLQRITRSGVISFGPNGLIVPPDSINFSANFIVSDRTGGVLYFFLDQRAFPNHSYFIQRIDSSGQFIWDSLGVWFYYTQGNAGFALSARPFYSDMRGGSIYVWAEQEPGFGVRVFMKQISINGILGEVITAIKDGSGEVKNPESIELKSIYPNPFNNSTTIEFSLNESTLLELKIYDILGKEITTLVKERLSPNIYKVSWDGTDHTGRVVSSGIYFCRLSIGKESVITQKMLFIQ